MDKKKGIILAIVLFLLIGLGTFVFANPSDKSLSGDNTQKPEVEPSTDGNELDESNTGENASEGENEEETVETLGTNSSTGKKPEVSTDNKPSNDEDDSYDLALAAVVKAEGSFSQEDTTSAKDLVSKVTDEKNKAELSERIEAVQNTIDVTALVKELENRVYNSENIGDMNDSRDYESNEEVNKKVDNLSNSDRKVALLATMDKLNKLLDDKTAPVIKGIEDGAYTNSDVSITILDDNEVTLKLNGKEVTLEDLKDIKEEGTYTLTVEDAAFNSASIEFTIDKTLKYSKLGITNITNYPDGTLDYVKLNEKIRVLVYFEEKLKVEPKVKVGGKEFTATYREYSSNPDKNEFAYYADIKITDDLKLDESEIAFEVYGYEDIAGNVGEVLTNNDINMSYKKVIFDKTAPTATVEYSTTDLTNKSVIVTLTASEEVEVLNAGTWNPKEGFGTVFKKSYPENATQTVTIRDKAGNESTVEVKIENIDKTAPTAIVEYSTTDLTNKSVIVTLTASEEVEVLNAGTWNPKEGFNTVFKKSYPENTTQTVTIRDKAGNESTVEVKIENIDKTAPTATVEYSTTDLTNKSVIVTLTANEEVEVLNAGTWNPKEGFGTVFKKSYPENATQTVTIRDKAGNESTVEVKIENIDKIAPTATVEYSTTELTNKSVVVTLTASEEVEVLNAGTWNPKEGFNTVFKKSYPENTTQTVTIRDKAGNESTVEVKIENIDKIAPDYNAVNFYVTGGYQKDNTYYAGYGDTIVAYIRTNEKLSDDLTFVLNYNGKSITLSGNNIEFIDENKETFTYLYRIKYEITDDVFYGFEDAEVTLAIKNVMDEAGNETTDHITGTTTINITNSNKVIIDIKAPDLFLTGANSETISWGSDFDESNLPIRYEDNITANENIKVNVWYNFKAVGSNTYETNLTKLDTKKAGLYYQYISVEDEVGNVSQNISKAYIVEDKIKPEINKTLETDLYLPIGAEFTVDDLLKNVTASDNNDGNISDKIYLHRIQDFNTQEILLAMDMNQERTYSVQFGVYDASGNKSFTLYRVHVVNQADYANTVISNINNAAANRLVVNILSPVTLSASDLNIPANKVIYGNGNLNIEGTLNINNSNIKLYNVNVKSDFSALVINPKVSGIVVDGGNYITTTGVQGEGTIRLNAYGSSSYNSDIVIKNAYIKGAIHLLNYNGSLDYITNNTLVLDNVENSSWIGILVLSDSNRFDQIALNTVYKNNNITMNYYGSTINYYAAIQNLNWQDRYFIEVTR